MFDFTPTQQKAIDLITSRSQRIVTIAGYAGTGKTTIVAEAISRLRNAHPKIKVGFACYTGKAAQVLSDKLYSEQVCTTHRLLYNTVSKKTYYSENFRQHLHHEYKDFFQFHPSARHVEGTMFSYPWVHIPKRELKYHIVVIDELSMLPTKILRQLLSYSDVDNFILLGDPAQLPPVGNDEGIQMQMLSNPDVLLTEVKRQGSGSLLLKEAMRVRAGNTLYRGFHNKEIWSFTFDDKDTYTFNQFIIRYLECIKSDPRNTENIAVLSFTNEVRYRFNQFIHHRLHPEEPFRQPPKDYSNEHYPTLHINDRVMCTVNDYQNISNHLNHIINGTVGIITAITPKYNEEQLENILALDMGVPSDTPPEEIEALKKDIQEYTYTLTHFKNSKGTIIEESWEGIERHHLTLAYSITVHKAQGSEYDRIFLLQENAVLGMYHTNMDNYYRWVYTAITRARSFLALINCNILYKIYELYPESRPQSFIKKKESESRKKERTIKKINQQLRIKAKD